MDRPQDQVEAAIFDLQDVKNNFLIDQRENERVNE